MLQRPYPIWHAIKQLYPHAIHCKYPCCASVHPTYLPLPAFHFSRSLLGLTQTQFFLPLPPRPLPQAAAVKTRLSPSRCPVRKMLLLLPSGYTVPCLYLLLIPPFLSLPLSLPPGKMDMPAMKRAGITPTVMGLHRAFLFEYAFKWVSQSFSSIFLLSGPISSSSFPPFSLLPLCLFPSDRPSRGDSKHRHHELYIILSCHGGFYRLRRAD